MGLLSDSEEDDDIFIPRRSTRTHTASTKPLHVEEEADNEDSDDDLFTPVFTKKSAKSTTTRTEKRAFSLLDSMIQKSAKRNESKIKISNLEQKEEEDEGQESDDILISLSDRDKDKKKNSNSRSNTTIEFNDEYWSKLELLSKNPHLATKEKDRRKQNVRDAIDGLDAYHTNNETATAKKSVKKETATSSSSSSFEHISLASSPTYSTSNDHHEREMRMASAGLVTGKSTLVGTRNVLFQSPQKNHHQDEEKAASIITQSQAQTFGLFKNQNEAVTTLKDIIKLMDQPLPSSRKRKSPSSSSSSSSFITRKLWNDVRNEIIIPFQKAMNANMLPMILEKRKRWGRSHNNDSPLSSSSLSSSIVIPIDLLQWLIKSSLSGRYVDFDLHHSSNIMICRIMNCTNNNYNNKLIILDTKAIMNAKHDGNTNDDNDCNGNNGNNGNNDDNDDNDDNGNNGNNDDNDDNENEYIIKHVFHIQDIISILKGQFGLWTKSSKSLLSSNKNNPTVAKNADTDSFTSPTRNESGLKHAFEIFSIVFEKDLVVWNGDFNLSCSKESWNNDIDSNTDNDEKEYEDIYCMCSETSTLIALLCRVGIDPSLHSGHG